MPDGYIDPTPRVYYLEQRMAAVESQIAPVTQMVNNFNQALNEVINKMLFVSYGRTVVPGTLSLAPNTTTRVRVNFYEPMINPDYRPVAFLDAANTALLGTLVIEPVDYSDKTADGLTVVVRNTGTLAVTGSFGVSALGIDYTLPPQ